MNLEQSSFRRGSVNKIQSEALKRIKMQVLQFCTRFWKFLGLFNSSDHVDQDTNDFLKTIQSYIVLFNSSILMVIASGTFIVKNFTNFDEVTVEMEVFCAGIQAVGVYLPVGMNMHDAMQMILEIQTLADKGTFSITDHFRWTNRFYFLKCLYWYQQSFKLLINLDDEHRGLALSHSKNKLELWKYCSKVDQSFHWVSTSNSNVPQKK